VVCTTIISYIGIRIKIKYTLARDEIHGVAVMISSPAGADDMPSLRLG
jgi:hypothetical protein